jgi:Organic solute transporter Ostalpha
VAAGAIKRLGPYTDSEHISLGLTDCLICIEMPFFAWAHLYAFSFVDFLDPSRSYIARMPMYYAFRDAFGIRDVVEDSKVTLRGQGMDYREFEPSEGYMHQGEGRERRIRAGLRYSKGGKKKYWLPQTTRETQPRGTLGRGVNKAIGKIAGSDYTEDVHAPLLQGEAEDEVHLAPDMMHNESDIVDPHVWGKSHADEGFDLPFGDIDDQDEQLFEHSRKYLFGDYNYPCIDASSEYAREMMWDEEERILRDERGAWFSPIRGAKGTAALKQRDGPAWEGYGAVSSHPRNAPKDGSGSDYMSPRNKGKRRGYDDEHAGDRLVDYEQDRTPPVSVDDVKLKWTNVKKSLDRPQSHSHSPQIQSSAYRTSSYGAGASSSSPASSGSSGSRPHGSRSKKTLSPPVESSAKSPMLPSDAVDLIVEDDEAAEEERTWERRKGEPAVRGSALRKVYRKGFVIHDSEGHEAQGEVEFDNPETEYVPENQDKAPPNTDAGVKKLEEEEEVVEAAEGTIARAVTPPPHSRAVLHSYDIHGEDNPWA